MAIDHGFVLSIIHFFKLSFCRSLVLSILHLDFYFFGYWILNFIFTEYFSVNHAFGFSIFCIFHYFCKQVEKQSIFKYCSVLFVCLSIFLTSFSVSNTYLPFWYLTYSSKICVSLSFFLNLFRSLYFYFCFSFTFYCCMYSLLRRSFNSQMLTVENLGDRVLSVLPKIYPKSKNSFALFSIF